MIKVKVCDNRDVKFELDVLLKLVFLLYLVVYRILVVLF